MGLVPALAWWAALPVGSLATAILVVNNIRDADTDVLCGKRTLAVRFGRGAARMEYLLLLVMAFAVPILLVARAQVGLPGLLPCLSAPLALHLARRVCTSSDAQILNTALKGSAGLLLAFGSLFAAGLCFG
jgi:1,4-dihydroxy-2-naphthoate octaprenyltransferase